MEYIYAALLLHKLGKPIDEEGISKILHATGASADESKVKSLIASLKDVDIETELANAVVASAAPAGNTGTAKPAEEKKEEKKAEESTAGLSALFG